MAGSSCAGSSSQRGQHPVPELPDVELYLSHIERVAGSSRLGRIELVSPFVLRSVAPRPAAFEGRCLLGTRRIGKRIVLDFGESHFAVIHLMIAGRFQWLAPDAPLHKKRTLVGFRFDSGTLQLTEAGTKRRASLHLVEGEAALAEHDRGGIDVRDADLEAFAAALRAENHTLKRSLSDQRFFSGIGNAYSDEILVRAGLSPIAMSQKLSDEQVERLHRACVLVLQDWIELLAAQNANVFPKKVTAFRPEMNVHGKYGQPCGICGTPVQRIVYASRETNYCPSCQTGGKLLADRALSRILKRDWPRSIEDLENYRSARSTRSEK